MNVRATPILPVSQISPRSIGYSYTSPVAFVPPQPPVHTVGTPSSPQYPSQWNVPRANPVPVVPRFGSGFSGTGGSFGRPIAQPARPVAPIARVTSGLFT